jgi:DNA-directed RNA polymerase specialized sigma24 family protein
MIEDLLHRIPSNLDVPAVEAAIANLPADYGIVLDLRYGWGLSLKEIATLLGWSTGKVSQRLTRATSLLKYELHPETFHKAKGLIKHSL